VADLWWYLERIGWIDILDVLTVALILFWILYLVRGTRAVPVLRGVIFLIIASSLLTSFIRLRAFGWLARNALPAMLVAIPVVFQPELRRALERLGRAGALVRRSSGERAVLEQAISAIVSACGMLAGRKYGALIVIERDTGLQEFVDSGVLLDAVITPELLVNIFDPHTPLHDGAVVVRAGRATAAALGGPSARAPPSGCHRCHGRERCHCCGRV